MSEALSENRLAVVVGEEQAKVKWPEKILLRLQEHLYIVQKKGQKIVKCECGCEFGDHKVNWKYNSLVYDRNPKDVYPGITGHNPDWCTYREFYCPSCLTQLEVEAVPHGVPVLNNVELDLE